MQSLSLQEEVGKRLAVRSAKSAGKAFHLARAISCHGGPQGSSDLWRGFKRYAAKTFKICKSLPWAKAVRRHLRHAAESGV